MFSTGSDGITSNFLWPTKDATPNPQSTPTASRIWEIGYPVSSHNVSIKTSEQAKPSFTLSDLSSSLHTLTEAIPTESSTSSTQSSNATLTITSIPVYGITARGAPPETLFASGAQTIVPGRRHSSGARAAAVPPKGSVMMPVGGLIVILNMLLFV